MGFLRKGRRRGAEAWGSARERAVVVGFAVVVALEVWVAWALRESGPALGPLPVPNGYTNLVEVGLDLKGAPPEKPAQIVRPDDADDQPPPTGPADLPFGQVDRFEVRAYLDVNKSLREQARLDLPRPARVPVEFVRGYAGKSKRQRDALAKLALLFQWEAWLAESEGRHDDAARADLDLVRLGATAGYGGLEADAWFGYDLINGGLAGLRRRLHRLEIEPCLDAIAVLAAIDAKRAPHAHVIARQKEYDRAEGRPVSVAILQFASWKARRADKENIERALEVVANLRLTQVELALRVHRVRNGADPNTLDELAPSLARPLPVDPFSQQGFHYQRTRAGHLLYSLGPDHHDDGGAELERSSFPPTGDINPESLSSTFEPIIAR